MITLAFIILQFNWAMAQFKQEHEILEFEPFIWKSEIPEDCPFEKSEKFVDIKFLGFKSGFSKNRVGDTWYPSWAADDKMYSPFTDGSCPRLDGSYDISYSNNEQATTGQAVIEGDDPTNIKIYSLGIEKASPAPYEGRYPCGSLVYDSVWYYGTYCLGPAPGAKYGDKIYNWPWLGPFVGFRYSTDKGRSWKECPLTPDNPLFGETGKYGYPVKIGSPHFVDFGKNMQYSPDGKAYLLAHGADINDKFPRFNNHSWINGDQIYLIRVTPSIENINDISKYEFYAGKNKSGNPIWTNDFKKIKPLLEWNNNMGCVTATYNPYLKKYIMCITDGMSGKEMNTYLLEADSLTGDWKIITYMKNFGEQTYFVNIPSKFISKNGTTMWLLYSGNWQGETKMNPPGSHYGMVLQKIELKRPFKSYSGGTEKRHHKNIE
jgi:hypothetical protein